MRKEKNEKRNIEKGLWARPSSQASLGGTREMSKDADCLADFKEPCFYI